MNTDHKPMLLFEGCSVEHHPLYRYRRGIVTRFETFHNSLGQQITRCVLVTDILKSGVTKTEVVDIPVPSMYLTPVLEVTDVE